MGRRGPRPEPNAVKIAKGTLRPQDAKANPEPKRARPRCPQWLSKDGRKAWRAMVKELEAMGVLTVADGHALAAYCETWARWKQVAEDLQANGNTETTPSGYRQQRAEVAIYNNLVKVLRGYQQEFGLTPAARTEIQVSHVDSASVSALSTFMQDAQALRMAT